ncbi:MAG: hypothetical protein HYZ36_04620, partial [Pedosphaera parvula]|nr:hypothetical protein [Pedosphaera parvula]
MGLLCGSVCVAQTSNTASIAEQFKQYLASPRSIDTIVFSTKYYNQLTPSEWFIGRWQSNAFCLGTKKGVSPELTIETGSVMVGRSKDHLWNYCFNVLHEAYAPNVPTNHFLVHLSQAYERWLFEGMDMGMVRLEGGTLIWEGNNFVATTPNSKGIMHGVLMLTPEKIPARIEFRLFEGGPLFLVDLYYSTNVGAAFFPNRMVRHAAGNPKP